jgi:hypothetical protein
MDMLRTGIMDLRGGRNLHGSASNPFFTSFALHLAHANASKPRAIHTFNPRHTQNLRPFELFRFVPLCSAKKFFSPHRAHLCTMTPLKESGGSDN